MKTQILLILSALLCSALSAQTRIDGQVRNLASGQVLLLEPFDGQFFPSVPKKIAVDSRGNFKAELETQTPGFAWLTLDGHRIRFYVEPGSGEQPDHVSVDLDRFEKTLQFTGHHAEQNEFLNGLERPFLPAGKLLSEVGTPFFSSTDSPKQAWQAVADHQDAECKLLKNVAKEKGFSDGFVQAVEADIEAYHLAVFGSVAHQHWLLARQGSAFRFDGKWADYWKKSLRGSSLHHLDFAKSEWYVAYLDQYIREYRLGFMGDAELTDPDPQRGEQFLEYDRLAWKYLQPAAREYYLAAIFSAASQKGRGEPLLAEQVAKFMADFPQSRFRNQFAWVDDPPASDPVPVEDPVPAPASIHLLGQDGDINSMRELLRPFKGKVVYVDVWATWCTPCLFELNHHGPLDRFAEGKDLVLLYISVDEDGRDAKWRKMIADKGLSGFHVRATPLLRSELVGEFGEGDNLTVPTYLIYDKKGNLVERKAKQPSHNTLLFNQLSQYLK